MYTLIGNCMKFIVILISVTLLSAQIFGGYGRNKVQYNEFDWKILKTEHFDVYYYPEMENMAEKGAYLAEENYKELSQTFNHSIRARVPIIFYSTQMHFQETNITPGFIPDGVGGFFEFLKGRVVIPGNGNMNQFRKVIKHELVHVFMHAKLNYNYRKRGKLSGPMPPLWFVEGLAEFYSHKWDYNGEMIMKDAVLNNYLPTLPQMNRIYGSYVMYKVGENILHYIAENYGEEKILQILNNMWREKEFDKVVELTLGEDFNEISKKWHYAQRKHYYPYIKDLDFAETTTNSIEHYGFNYKPIYNPKTEEVIFWSNRTGYTGIYKKSIHDIEKKPDEGDVELVLTGERSGDFEAFHITSNRMDVNDLQQLVFTSKSQANDALYIFDLVENEIIKKHVFKDNMVNIASPSWSPDNKKVVFSVLDMSGYKDIYTFNTETDELKRITNDFYDDIDPVWSPDSKSIVFSSDRTSKGDKWSYNIFKHNLETNETKYMTFAETYDTSPIFSPNGKWIAFISTKDNQKNIHIIPANNEEELNEPEKVTHLVSSIFDFDWVNNNELVFTVFENRQFMIQHKKNIFKDGLPKFDNELLIGKSEKISTWDIPLASKKEVTDRENYDSEYTIDIAQTQLSQDPIFGTTGGAYIGISDILGDELYSILLFSSAETSGNVLKSFNFKLSKFNLGNRINYGFGLFRFSGRRYDLRDFYNEDEVGADGIIHYPFNQYNRLEFYQNIRYSERNSYGDRLYSWLSTTSLSYVKDNSIWSYTGPMEGDRWKISIGYNKDVANNNINYFTYLVDFRKYFRTSLQSSYAVRVMTLVNKGKRNRYFAMGGSWDMRGYKFLSMRGDHLFLISQEYRYPLLDFLGFKVSSGPVIGTNMVRGAFFIDAGNAYQGSYNFDELVGSFGVGFRVNVLGALVMRWDVGRHTDFKTIGKENFVQFFFGWDF